MRSVLLSVVIALVNHREHVALNANANDLSLSSAIKLKAFDRFGR